MNGYLIQEIVTSFGVGNEFKIVEKRSMFSVQRLLFISKKPLEMNITRVIIRSVLRDELCYLSFDGYCGMVSGPFTRSLGLRASGLDYGPICGIEVLLTAKSLVSC